MNRHCKARVVTSIAFLCLSFLTITACKQKKFKSEDRIQTPAENVSEPKKPVVKFQPDKLFKSQEAIGIWKQFQAANVALEKVEKARLVLLAKCGDEEGKGPTRLVVVPDKDHWPEDRLEVYVALLNESRKVILLQVIPMSASGDWAESEDFFADSNGVIRYWEFFRATVDSLEEPETAWQAIARHPDGSEIERVGKAVDSHGQPWEKTKPTLQPPPPHGIKSVLQKFGILDSLITAKVAI
jgi:hypothetical protein